MRHILKFASILMVLAGIVCNPSKAAEGKIWFTTSNPHAEPPINAPVYGWSLIGGLGPTFHLRLYRVAEDGKRTPLDPPADFRRTSLRASSYIVPSIVSVPGTQPGEQIVVFVALEHKDYPGRIYAASEALVIPLGGGNQPPASLTGLQGFTFPLGNSPNPFSWRVAHEVEPELPENTMRVIDAVEDGARIVVAVETVNSGVTNHALVRLNSDGTADGTFKVQAPTGGRIRKLYSPSVLIGEFTGLPGQPSVAAFEANGQLAWSFGEAGFEVTSLTAVPGGFVAGGNGTRSFDLSGQPLAGFPEILLSPSESRIKAIWYSTETGSLLIGGDFEAVNDRPIQYFSEIRGQDVTEGEFRVNGPVRTIKVLDYDEPIKWRPPHLVVTGDFTEVNGEPQAYIAGTPYKHVKIEAAPGNFVSDVAGDWYELDSTVQIWAVGQFQKVNGLRRPNLVGTPFWRVTDPLASIDGPIDGVLSVEVSDDHWVKWIWGSFKRINGKTVGSLVKLVRASAIHEPAVLTDGRFNFWAAGGSTIEVSTDLKEWTVFQNAAQLVWENGDQPQLYFRLRND